MKVKCNVCKSPTVIEILEPTVFREIITCPNCEKLLAIAYETTNNDMYWYLFTKYDTDYGCIPVEIIEQ